MIIQCQGCAAKYFLSEDKVPEIPTKVRCPKCTAVFTLVPQPEPVTAGAPAVAPSAPSAPPAVEPVPEPAAAPATSQPATAPAPKAPKEKPKSKAKSKAKPKKGKKRGRSDDDRAKRLARVLVSDILCYNQDKRDQALEDGTLMTVLGEEIKKSWELYKEKVGPELASSTNYFKEALNEILADGQEVF
jgi:predicted Zn finger-like uncharacterized protein